VFSVLFVVFVFNISKVLIPKFMKHLINFLAIFTLGCGNLHAQSGWYQQSSGTVRDIRGIQFVGDNTGYIVTRYIGLPDSGRIIRTTNGGQNWITILSASGTYFEGLHFIDMNTGTVVGEAPFKRTTNGGTSWFNQNNPYLPCAWKVHFINSSTGMAVGCANQSNNGGVIYTSDGGTTWFDRSVGHDYAHWGVQLLDPITAVVVGLFAILKTTNAGLSWIWIEYPTGCYGVSFLNSNQGIACGCYGGANYRAIKKTTNAGNNWTTIYNIPWYRPHRDIQYIDNDNMVAVGDTGSIHRSTNGGVNWFQQASGTTVDLKGVWFINPNTGWAVGNNGVILKTTTGGFTAVRPISNEIPAEFKLYQNYPNPFNSKTVFSFQLPVFSHAELSIYDVLGREVKILVNQELRPGTYEVEFDGSNYPSGVYYYRLIAGDYTETRKFVLMK
jgi:photosystem II stability/assembly factor-like uncharacterized protein